MLHHARGVTTPEDIMEMNSRNGTILEDYLVVEIVLFVFNSIAVFDKCRRVGGFCVLAAVGRRQQAGTGR